MGRIRGGLSNNSGPGSSNNYSTDNKENITNNGIGNNNGGANGLSSIGGNQNGVGSSLNAPSTAVGGNGANLAFGVSKNEVESNSYLPSGAGAGGIDGG